MMPPGLLLLAAYACVLALPGWLTLAGHRLCTGQLGEGLAALAVAAGCAGLGLACARAASR